MHVSRYEQEQRMAAIDENERNALMGTDMPIPPENISYFTLDLMCSYRRPGRELSPRM
jgi:hypothetical protein